MMTVLNQTICIINKQQTSDPIRLKIYEEKIAPRGHTPRFYDRKTGVAMIRNSSFAYFGEERESLHYVL